MLDISRDIPVLFDEGPHIYTNLEGQRYTSATQCVEKFREHFDTPVAAQKYAAKHGGTPEYWIEQWRIKNEKSILRGNTIHDANEVALHGRMFDIFGGKSLPVHGGMIQDIDPWSLRPDGVYTERLMWHHGYKLSGKADKVILLTDPVNPKIRYASIDDYKTNERLEKVSYQFKGSGNYKMMKPPLGHIMDCNWWHYQLQLSLYMFMLEYQGFVPGDMRIKYYPHPTEEIPNPKAEYFPVTYMKREVVNMLSYMSR